MCTLEKGRSLKCIIQYKLPPQEPGRRKAEWPKTSRRMEIIKIGNIEIGNRKSSRENPWNKELFLWKYPCNWQTSSKPDKKREDTSYHPQEWNDDITTDPADIRELCWVKKTNPQSLYTMLFHFCNILEMTKFQIVQKWQSDKNGK